MAEGGGRGELQDWVRELAAALVPYAGGGGARMRVGVNAAHHDDVAADLEGYARPLWGLAPLAAGGGAFAHWDVWAAGLAAGADPEHPGFWGVPGDRDQRIVEAAAVGFALALAPDRLWDPLTGRDRGRAGAWLASCLHRATPPNNWNFFPVLISLGLDRVGYPHDRDARTARLDRIEGYWLGEGWYADGSTPQRDYYVPWALHFYGLLYAALAGQEDPARAARYRERAAEFAAGFRHWFADDGSAVPFGRSLTYRFAQGAFWGALPYAGVDVLPPGEVSGLLMRHLRWWRDRTAAVAPGGVLSVGYGYPQPALAEQYNGPGSPYWAMKAFLPLALPASHPFWAAAEQPPADLPEVLAQPHAGAVLMRSGGDVTLLGGSQHHAWVRGGAAKYAKFAYSTRFGFSVPAGTPGLVHGAYDSMLAVSDDAGAAARDTEGGAAGDGSGGAAGDGVRRARHYRVREESFDAVTADDGTVRSVWRPWPDVEITTWLSAAAAWHLRTHRIRTARALHTAEAGFAVDRDGEHRPPGAAEGFAVAHSAAGDLSGVRDLGSVRTGEAAGDAPVVRQGEVIEVLPGTNVLAPRTALPTLVAELPPGEHWLRCAVLGAGPAAAAAWDGEPPAARH